MFRRLIAAPVTEPAGLLDVELVSEVEQKTVNLLQEIKRLTGGAGDEATIAQEIRQELEAILQLPVLESRFPLPKSRKYKSAVKLLNTHLDEDTLTWGTLFGWCCVHSLGKLFGGAGYEQQSRSWIDEWLLGKIIAGVLQDLGLDEASAWRGVAIVKLLTAHARWFEMELPKPKRAYQVVQAILGDDEIQRLLQVNRHQGVLWFNKEAFERLLWWMLSLAVIEETSAAHRLEPQRPAVEVAQAIVEHYDIVKKLQQAEKKSGYQVEKLLEAVKVEPRPWHSPQSEPPKRQDGSSRRP
jgi:hypothetical protein